MRMKMRDWTIAVVDVNCLFGCGTWQVDVVGPSNQQVLSSARRSHRDGCDVIQCVILIHKLSTVCRPHVSPATSTYLHRMY